MTDQQQRATTKIEITIEALEDFINAVFSKRNRRLSGSGLAGMDNLNEARRDLANAFKAMFQPTLRVIDGGGQPQPYMDGYPEEDKPTCTLCFKNQPCSVNCPMWAAAIRKIHNRQALSAESKEGDSA